MSSQLSQAFLPSPTLPSQKPQLTAHRTPLTCNISAPTLRAALAAAAAAALLAVSPVLAADTDVRPQLKVFGGSASTSSGKRAVVKTLTRGVNLEGANFSEQDFEGVSFQQSILRQADFTRASLMNASFFDADLSGAKFRDADLRGVNVS